MTDISNRTIVALLVVALMVTVLSTIISVSKLSQLGGKNNYFQMKVDLVTGAQGAGSSNLTITSTTSLTIANASMNFGSGRVNSSCDWCWLTVGNGLSYVGGYSNGSNLSAGALSLPPCCLTFTVLSQGFFLENTGNNNVSVGYTCGGGTGGAPGVNCSHTNFVGGDRYPLTSGLEIRVQSGLTEGNTALSDSTGTADTVQSCTGGGSAFRGWTNWNITNATTYTGNAQGSPYNGQANTFQPLMSTGHWLCGNATVFPLESNNNRDSAVVDINITIPALATPGAKGITLVFNASSS